MRRPIRARRDAQHATQVRQPRETRRVDSRGQISSGSPCIARFDAAAIPPSRAATGAMLAPTPCRRRADAVPTPCRRRNRQRHRTSTNGSTAPAVQGMGARSSGSETLVRPAAAMSHDAHVRTALANRADAPTGKMGRIGIAIPSSAECAVSGAGRTTSPCHAGHAAWPRLPARCRTAPRQPRQAMSSPCNRAQTAEPATNEFAAARTCP